MPEPGSVYLSLKLAAKLFAKPLEALSPEELQRVGSVAVRQQAIETLILQTPEAASVMLPEASVAASLQEIRDRYASDEEQQADLARLGLDAASLRQAVRRDMAVEAVLQKVGARAAAVSDTEVEIFWFMHQERFQRGETRTLRHILITINDAFAGNQREVAGERMDAIRTRLLKEPGRFAEQALKHSECPTAMNGGVLGKVTRGQLYAELEQAAFALAVNELSAVVESELGFHLLRCDAIDAAQLLSLAEAGPGIRRHLEGQRRGICQKAWINALRRQAAT